ncbi:MAG: hypothetical protein GXP18_13400 [Gammaproteobacteria bacterium]|nr:hypothetical protein [Gammaproteobacteria bacterium]
MLSHNITHCSIWHVALAMFGLLFNQMATAEINASSDAGQFEEEYSPYADVDFCDENEIDEEAFPENLMETLYHNARMAFMFGQYEIAFEAWKPLANEGYAKAQAALAWMYHTGNGVKRNMTTAVSWYRKAADQGHAIAQNNLAVMYESGLGADINPKAAAFWFKESASSGYSFAQYNIGRMYAEGFGVKQDRKEAKYWWRIAARQGVEKATESLALLENRPVIQEKTASTGPAIAHAPYHSNPVAKGLAWIEGQQRGHYTIQLARSKDANWILKLAASGQLDQVMVQFKSKDKKGEEWINLIYGSFSSFQAAEKTRKSLPASFREWSPWLRRFGEINAILLK